MDLEMFYLIKSAYNKNNDEDNNKYYLCGAFLRTQAQIKKTKTKKTNVKF